MNTNYLRNEASNLLNEVRALIERGPGARKAQGDAKYKFEDAEQRLGDLQAFIYTQLMQDKAIDWTHPSPVLDVNGKPVAEYEVQYRTMYANWLIQQNESFQALLAERNKAKSDYYEAEREVLGLMENIGVLKTQMALIAALLRLADEE